MVPAPVMGGRPAPRLVGDPGPAVRGPGPVAVRVRAPADRDVGPPDVADIRLEVPGPVALEVVRVRADLLRQVLVASARVGFVSRARRPSARTRRPRRGRNVRSPRLLAAARERALAAARTHALARVQERLALEDGQARLALRRVDAIDAALARAGRGARRLDHELGRALPFAMVHVHAAGPEAQDHLSALRVVPAVVELAAAVEPQQRAVREMELDAPAAVGPDAVARQEGHVGGRLLRPRLDRALQGDHRLDHPHSRVAERVVLRGQSERDGKDAGRQRHPTCHGEPLRETVHSHHAMQSSCPAHAMSSD